MSLKMGKLIKTKKVFGFLEMTAYNILLEELKLTYNREQRLSAVVRFFELETGDTEKKLIVVETFRKQHENKRLLSVQSSVEYYRDFDLWLPQTLKLRIGEVTPLHFRCEVVRKNDTFEYSVMGPVNAQSV